MATDLNKVRAVGRSAMAGMRRTFAERMADLLSRDPDRLSAAVEMGIIRREWLEEPGSGEAVSAAPVEVVERFLQRSVEQKPSLLSSLGLTAIQGLMSNREDQAGDGLPTCVAVAFTDLEGFTRYTSSEGDEAASQLLAEHHRRVGPVVRSRGGRIVKHLGDGLLLTFPEPEAAVMACLELCESQPPPLRLRAGIHLGDVVSTRDDVIGHVVNVAARVTESARGGEVLCTDAVREAAGDLPRLHFSRPRRRTFKGVDESVRVCRVGYEETGSGA